MRLLLDINVWIALFDDAHVFATQANALIARPKVRIATCPLVDTTITRTRALSSGTNSMR